MTKRLILLILAGILLAGCNNYNRILEEIHDKDQAAREWVDGLASLSATELEAYTVEMHQIDSLNQLAVFGILDKMGWPDGLSEKADDAIWLVIDHSDIESRKKYLPLIRQQVEEGNVSATDFATLNDRILMEEGKPQIYGTQVKMLADIVGDQSTISVFLWPVEDAAALDSLRASIGLLPITEYLVITGQTLGQPVVWDRNKTVADF